MAFNVGNFIKSTAKSAAEKTIDRIVGNVVSGLPMNTRSIASSTASSLFNLGASYDSIQSLASSRTDSIVSRGADEFFAFAGRDVNRSSSADIAKSRMSSKTTTDAYIKGTNPETKIAGRRNLDEYEVFSIV